MYPPLKKKKNPCQMYAVTVFSRVFLHPKMHQYKNYRYCQHCFMQRREKEDLRVNVWQSKGHHAHYSNHVTSKGRKGILWHHCKQPILTVSWHHNCPDRHSVWGNVRHERKLWTPWRYMRFLSISSDQLTDVKSYNNPFRRNYVHKEKNTSLKQKQKKKKALLLQDYKAFCYI